MSRSKLLKVGTAFFALILISQIGSASNGNPFHKIMERLDLIVQLLEEDVIPQLGCENIVGVPKTGQITPYAVSDDGDLQVGIAPPIPRFTDNDDGTVTDNRTGLVWLKNANCFGELTWSDALNSCNNLASPECGLTDGSQAGDWRLANVREVFSLIDFGQFDPALPIGHPFINVQSDYYWSSTTKDAAGNAWNVYMYYGNVGGHYKTFVDYVWPVPRRQLANYLVLKHSVVLTG